VVLSVLLLQEDEKGADAAVGELFSKFGSHEKLNDVVFDLAYDCRTYKNWGRSRDLFQYFADRWPSDERAVLAQRMAAKASIRAEDDANAVAGTDKLLSEYGEREGIEEQVAELADDWAEAGKYERATGLYKLVLERWAEHVVLCLG
jgi:hypothetical protein